MKTMPLSKQNADACRARHALDTTPLSFMLYARGTRQSHTRTAWYGYTLAWHGMKREREYCLKTFCGGDITVFIKPFNTSTLSFYARRREYDQSCLYELPFAVFV